MKFISWNEGYSVHVEEIDAQHQWLADIINALHDDAAEKKGRRLLEIVLESLIKYALAHFETEESLMIEYEYPAYEAHKLQHIKLGEKITAWNQDFVDGKTGFPDEAVVFLKDWLENHECSDDRTLGVFLNSKGVK